MFFHVELFSSCPSLQQLCLDALWQTEEVPKAHAAGVDEVHDVDVVGAQLVEEAEALDIYRKNRNQRMFFS